MKLPFSWFYFNSIKYYICGFLYLSFYFVQGPGRWPLCGGAASCGTQLVPPAPTNPPQGTAEPHSREQCLGNSWDKGGQNGEGNSEIDSPESPEGRVGRRTGGAPGIPARIPWEPLEESIAKTVVSFLPMEDCTQDQGDKSLRNCMERLPWSRFILKDCSLWTEGLKVPCWNKGKAWGGWKGREEQPWTVYNLTFPIPLHCSGVGR